MTPLLTDEEVDWRLCEARASDSMTALANVDTQQLSHEGKEVQMGIVKAGHDRPAGAVDNFSRTAGQPLQFRIIADEKYGVAGDGYQPGARPGRIHGDNVGVFQNKVGRHCIKTRDTINY